MCMTAARLIGSPCRESTRRVAGGVVGRSFNLDRTGRAIEKSRILQGFCYAHELENAGYPSSLPFSLPLGPPQLRPSERPGLVAKACAGLGGFRSGRNCLPARCPWVDGMSSLLASLSTTARMSVVMSHISGKRLLTRIAVMPNGRKRMELARSKNGLFFFCSLEREAKMINILFTKEFEACAARAGARIYQIFALWPPATYTAQHRITIP